MDFYNLRARYNYFREYYLRFFLLHFTSRRRRRRRRLGESFTACSPNYYVRHDCLKESVLHKVRRREDVYRRLVFAET